MPDRRSWCRASPVQTGRLFAEKMVSRGTPLVGGVTPGKGGSVIAGVPVFDSMREAVAATGANAVLCCIAPAVRAGWYLRSRGRRHPAGRPLYREHPGARRDPDVRVCEGQRYAPARPQLRGRGESRAREPVRPQRCESATGARRHRLEERHVDLRSHRRAAPPRTAANRRSSASAATASSAPITST